MTLDLVGPDEVAARLGVRSNTVSTWRARGYLPEPFAVVSRVPCWHWLEVRAWADATGRLGTHRAAPKVTPDEVASARAEVLAQLDALSAEALGILQACGVSETIRRPPARESLRSVSGRYRSLDGRGNGRGEWDWHYGLDKRTRDWLARSHVGPEPYRSTPDQVAAAMARVTGTDDTDAGMAEWLRCVRVIDAAAAVRARVPWRRCSHLFAGLMLAYDVGALFGSYADAATYLAELREEPDDEEPGALVARLGPSPLEMDFDEWRAELADLERRASVIPAVTGEWDTLSAEDQAVYDRLEELLPSCIAGPPAATLQDLYVAVVETYLRAVA